MEFLGMTQKRIRAAGYPRVSDENLKDSPTLDSQKSDVLRYIALHEYDHAEAHMYPEAMTAYYKPFRDRPQFMKLFAAARRKEFDVVVVTEFSRLSRRQVEQAVIIGILESYGIKVESCTEKFEDSAIGNFMRAVYAFVAEIEREKIVYRTSRGKMDRLQNGNLAGLGIPTYGYEYMDTEDETSARYTIRTEPIYTDQYGNDWTEPKVVIFIYGKAEEGWSVRKIAITLTALGIPTRRNRTVWSTSQVHRILTNRVYLGKAIANKWKYDENRKTVQRPQEEQIALPDGLIPPILVDESGLPDVTLFERVQERLDLSKVDSIRNNKHHKDLGLLRAGFAKCGICNYSLAVRYYNGAYGTRKNPHAPDYYCHRKTGLEDSKNHHSCTILISLLDDAAWKFALPYIINPCLVRDRVAELRSQVNKETNRAQIEATIGDLNRQIANLFKLSRAAENDDTLDQLTGVMQDLERQKRDAMRMLYEEEEEEEVRAKIEAEIAKFEGWVYTVGPRLSDPEYQPTYEEKRLAIRILGIQATVWPTGYEQRCKLEVAPPNIMSLIS